jgi:hypothetical protein
MSRAPPRKSWEQFALAFVLLVLVILIAPNTHAENDPGHDSLYVLRIGDTNITGTINLTGNVTATIVQATSRFFGPNVDIRGDGTSSGNANQIIGTATNLELSSSGNLILNKAVTGGMIFVGWTGTTTALNVTGNIFGAGTLNVTGNAYANGAQVCTASNGLCAGAGAVSSAGGWVNDSTSTRTTLITIVNSSSNSGSFIVQNTSGSNHLFINGSTGNVGVGTTGPATLLHVKGTTPTVRIEGARKYDLRLDADVSGQFDIADMTTGAARLVINPSGNIGIGTTAPEYKLELSSSAQNWATSPSIVFSDTAGQADSRRWLVGNVATDYGSFNIAVSTTNSDAPTNPKLTILKSGNVGIGTASPGQVLDVRGSALINSSSMTGSLQIVNTTGSTHVFVNGSSGSVGIGTGSPLEILQVNGGLRSGVTIVTVTNVSDGSVNSSVSIINVTSTTGYPGVGTLLIDAEALTYAGATGTSFTGVSRGALGTTPTNHTAGAVVNEYVQAVLRNATSPVFVALASGSVGVNVTAPGSTLEVRGSMNASSIKVGTTSVCLSDGTNCPAGATGNTGWTNNTGSGNISLTNTAANISANALYIDNTDGRVGIGTTGPGNLLHVYTNTTGEIDVAKFQNAHASGFTGVQIDRSSDIRYSLLKYSTAGTNDWWVGTAYAAGGSNSAYSIGTSNALSGAKLVIQTGGNVGIGTTTPQGILHVVTPGTHTRLLVDTDTASRDAQVRFMDRGAAKWAVGRIADNSYFYIYDEVNAVARLAVTNGGNVGIGTTSPASKLHVNGTDPTLLLTSSDDSGYQVGLQDLYSFSHSMTLTGVSGGEIVGVYSGNTALMTGNVGIGTTGPGYKLQVMGANAGTTGLFEAGITGITNGFVVGTDASNNITYQFRTKDDVVGLAQDASGNVGIGTTSPSDLLHVAANVDSNKEGIARFFNPGAATAGRATSILIGKSTANGGAANIGFVSDTATPANSYVYLSHYGMAEQLVIKNSGNVGIGTTGPTNKLSVLGSIGLSDTAFPGVAPAGLTTEVTGSLFDIGMNEGSGNRFGTYVQSLQGGMLTVDTRVGHALFTFAGRTAGTAANGYESPSMSILSSGNVGIGTTVPTSRLQVMTPNGGNMSVGDTFSFKAAPYVFDADESAGGSLTLTPGTGTYPSGSATLTGGRASGYYGAGAGASITAQGFDYAAGGNIIAQLGSNYDMSAFLVNSTASTTIFSILNNGNVGIGTASPGQVLDVRGPAIINSSSTTGSLQIVNATGSTHVYVNGSSGNVGIGTAAPGYALEVNGSIKLSGNITTPGNFFIGSGAAAAGTNAIAIGTSASAPGGSAVAIGASSKANGTNQGTAVGNGASAYGDFGTAFGVNALAATDGANAVGFGAIANGSSANAFGGSSIASGTTSVAFGALTRAYGDSSVSIGVISYTYGPSSIAIGSAAFTAAAGSDAIAIGSKTAANFTDSIALGANATATAANQMVIGNASTINNINGIIFGTWNATGNIYASGSQVCTATNGLCASAGGSAGGWANDSTSTRTTLRTIVNSSSDAGSFIVQNQTGSTHLFVNGSSGYVGIGTTAPNQKVEIAGSMNVSGQLYAYGNITLRAPNGSLYNCGVSDAGVFTCALSA